MQCMVLLLLHLGDGVLGVRAQVVGEHQQAQQLKLVYMFLQLVLGHEAQGAPVLPLQHLFC